eukprot:SAG11_NODE_26192_length_348_cov_1.425703_1_plen_30_part_10
MGPPAGEPDGSARKPFELHLVRPEGQLMQP